MMLLYYSYTMVPVIVNVHFVGDNTDFLLWFNLYLKELKIIYWVEFDCRFLEKSIDGKYYTISLFENYSILKSYMNGYRF